MGKYSMLHNINKVLCVMLDDGRTVTGKLLVFDKHMNVILGDALEERPQSKKMAEEGVSSKRQLGLILLRGEHVVSVIVMKDSENGGSGAVANFGGAPKSAKATAVKRKRGA
ncbi:small nuclear ribonucleoprotein protein,putative [Leishmania mexicana MHOM/GT/2001/U1103]|uniref:Sm protein B n=1 Tax=Leishmania mexicana (strain MHOM/GT/2001/U1103) TaxID=929439 RepID=E9AZA1_LEIMU|nr:small nuclear ribonucleoprotein protein,putative [Leishmania mexicana MHOM/GT/2001/U1103]CBZ28301.1 small nuclear ribonucleoprotein protein,putative [Leishmania mexicana MHOM/GT/2001/U1103]